MPRHPLRGPTAPHATSLLASRRVERGAIPRSENAEPPSKEQGAGGSFAFSLSRFLIFSFSRERPGSTRPNAFFLASGGGVFPQVVASGFSAGRSSCPLFTPKRSNERTNRPLRRAGTGEGWPPFHLGVDVARREVPSPRLPFSFHQVGGQRRRKKGRSLPQARPSRERGGRHPRRASLPRPPSAHPS